MTPSRQPANGIKKLPWWICTLLFLATLINYLDRQTFAVATPAIVEEFGLSNDDVANINIAFTSAYMVGQLVTGRFMDVLGTRLGFLLIMVFWSLSGTRGISSSSFFRFCLGFGGGWELAGVGEGHLGVVPGSRARARRRLLFRRRFGVGSDDRARADRAVDSVDGLALVICDHRWARVLVGAAVAVVLPNARPTLADAKRGT
jgi:hypothetical protein